MLLPVMPLHMHAWHPCSVVHFKGAYEDDSSIHMVMELCRWVLPLLVRGQVLLCNHACAAAAGCLCCCGGGCRCSLWSQMSNCPLPLITHASVCRRPAVEGSWFTSWGVAPTQRRRCAMLYSPCLAAYLLACLPACLPACWA
jgi:hypothetical protein